MRWEELTAAAFKSAVAETGVCVASLGVIEKHGEHLPLGTDFMNAHQIACLAAEKEPAVIFPPFYFGQINEARCFPGTITLRPGLLLDLIQGVFDEIGRNGFEKIVLFNAHGGNDHLLAFLAQCSLWEERPYSLYLPRDLLAGQRRETWQSTCETSEHGHACECETSISLINHGHLVKMDQVPEKAATTLGRLNKLPPTITGIHWYSRYPDHYAGDAKTASKEKGRILRGLLVDSLVEYLAAVKADDVVPSLNKEFFARVRDLSSKSQSDL